MKTLKLENLPVGSNVLIAYTDGDSSKIPEENFLYRQHTDFETPIISGIKDDDELIIRVRCAGVAGYYKPLEWRGFLENDDNIGVVSLAEEMQDRIISKIEFK